MLCHIRPCQHGCWAALLVIVVAIVAVALGAEAQQQKAPAGHRKEARPESPVPGGLPLDIKEKKSTKREKN